MDTLISLKRWLWIVIFILQPLYSIDVVWSTETPISPVDDTASYLSRSLQRCIAVGNDWRIHVVWHEQRSSDPAVRWGVWHAHSYLGVHWTIRFISDPIYGPGGYLYNYTNTDPSIAIINSAQVHAWWDGFPDLSSREFGIYGTSSDNGNSWQHPENPAVWEYWASEPPSGFNSLCSDGQNYLMFMDQQWVPDFMEYRLLGGFSTNGGTTWERTPWLGSTTRQRSDLSPCTACHSSDTGYVVWQSFDNSNNGIIVFAKFDTDIGAGPDTEYTLVPYPGAGVRKDAFIESNLGGKLYVVWSDSRDGNYEIYFKKSTDSGLTWSADIRLTNDPGNSANPVVTLGDIGQIFLVWIDNRDGNSEVYFKYSEDDGTTWNQDTRLTNDPGTCTNPHIAISPDKLQLYIVFNDTRNGQEEVYFKNGTITVGISESSQLQKEYEFEISPNPFHQSTCVKFQIPRANPPSSMIDQANPKPRVNLKIYDSVGRLVKSFTQLPITQLPDYQITWSGQDDLGRVVPAGVYFVWLEVGDRQQTEKAILLR